jgi:hypothetical protein
MYNYGMKIKSSLLALSLLIFTTPGFVLAQSVIDLGSVDLYVFAGQSNMKGHVATLSSAASGPGLIPTPYQEYYQDSVAWAQQWNANSVRPKAATDETLNSFGNKFVDYRAGYNPNNGRVDTWGPEVAFLYNRYQATQNTVYFVKYAIGGTSVGYKPTSATWSVQATGDNSLLNALVERVKRPTQALLDRGYSHVNIRLLWAQGESDVSAFGPAYLQNFSDTYAYLDSMLSTTTVSVHLDSMTLVANKPSNYARANINMAASKFDSQVVNEYSYPLSLFISDKIHLGPLGQIRHGEEMEFNTRTLPRTMVDNTATDITNATYKLPLNPINLSVIVYKIPSVVADGSTGYEILGDTTGLSMDAVKGMLRTVDVTQLVPGTRNITIRQHTATTVTDRQLILTITK